MTSVLLERTSLFEATWAEIPAALGKLWRDCLVGHEGSDVARSLTANFVAFAAADEAAALRSAVELLAQRAPCRAFLALLDEQVRTPRATIAATTRGQGRLRDIVLEEIVLRLPAAAAAQLPGLIRPLLVNDVPSHLFWAAPWPADSREFDCLAELCEHAIIDSRRFGNPARELLAVEQRRARGERLTDVNWLRLRPWRRALAEAFERFPWQDRARVRGVLHHGRKAQAAALLLADWLHARLAAALQIEPGSGTDSLLPDRLELLIGEVEVGVATRDRQLVVHVTNRDHCFLPFAVAASRGSEGDLVAAAIDRA